MSKPPEHRELVSALSSLKWSDVKLMAIHLPRMDITTLNMIEEGHPTEPKLWVVYAMNEWLQRDTEASWAKVVSALRETNMDSLATKIEEDHPMTTPLLSSHSASQPTSSVATASSTEPLEEYIAMPTQDEATCSPVDEILAIKNKAAMLRTKFRRVLVHTKICFMDKEEESKKFLRDFKVTLTSLPHEKKEEIKKANNVDEIFDILEPYCNYVDYDLLEYIIEEFGTSDLQEEMRKYIAELERYEKKTTVHDFSLATQGKVVVPAHYRELAVKLDKDPNECTLHDVRQFKRSVENESTLESYTLLFRGVICSSVEIILAFPPEAHAKLLEVFKNMQFRRKHKVVAEEFSGVQDVECKDLAEVEYVETHRHPMQQCSEHVKKKPVPITSEDRQHLENIHDAFVSKCVELMIEFQKTWKDMVTREEGLQLLNKSQSIVQNLLDDLKVGEKKLKSLPRSISGSSVSSSEGSECSTSPENSLSCE